MSEFNNLFKILNPDQIQIVLYHGNCYDGFGCAFIVWLYYKRKYGIKRANEIEYIPCSYTTKIKEEEKETINKDFVEKFKNKNILMCDFSYHYQQLLELIEISNSFLILDHHKTAEESLSKISENLKIFDMNKSGVGITWNYFFVDDPLPNLLAFIQDRDLWTNQLSNTKEFIAFYYEQKFDFELWEEYLNNQNLIDSAIITGSQWLQYHEIIINKIVDRSSYIIQKVGYEYLIILYSNSIEFKSDIGNKLFTKYPFGDFSVVWSYDLYKNETTFSLRSTNDRYDVSKIAKMFGGGGHRNASGMALSSVIGYLPFDKIDDHETLNLFSNKIKETISGITYTLFRVNQIKEIWLEHECLNLIKRKNNESLILVFEKISDQFPFMNDYVIIYNELNKNIEIQLQWKVFENNNHLVITSEKEFHDIFINLINNF